MSLGVGFESDHIRYTGKWNVLSVQEPPVTVMETSERGGILEVTFSAGGLIIWGSIPPLDLGPTPEALITLTQQDTLTPITSFIYRPSPQTQTLQWTRNQILWTANRAAPGDSPFVNTTLRIVNLVDGGYLAIEWFEFWGSSEMPTPSVAEAEGSSGRPTNTVSQTESSSSSQLGSTNSASTGSGEPAFPTYSGVVATAGGLSSGGLAALIILSLALFAVVAVVTTSWYFKRRNDKGLRWQKRGESVRGFNYLQGNHHLSTFEDRRLRAIHGDSDKNSYTNIPGPRRKRSTQSRHGHTDLKEVNQLDSIDSALEYYSRSSRLIPYELHSGDPVAQYAYEARILDEKADIPKVVVTPSTETFPPVDATRRQREKRNQANDKAEEESGHESTLRHRNDRSDLPRIPSLALSSSSFRRISGLYPYSLPPSPAYNGAHSPRQPNTPG